MSVPYPSADGGISVELGKGSAMPDSGSGKIDLFPIANQDFEKIKTLKDLALRNITLAQFPVVKAWREKLFAPEGTPEICDELPRLLTEFLRRSESQALSPYTRRAKALQYIFSNKTAIVHPEDLLPGQTTTSFVGPVVYADTIGYCIWPELKTVTTRAQNPFKIRPEVADRLNREIFPFWLEQKPIQELARYSDYDSAEYENRDKVAGSYQPSIDPPLSKKPDKRQRPRN
jgi:formate C-acetyltransferase